MKFKLSAEHSTDSHLPLPDEETTIPTSHLANCPSDFSSDKEELFTAFTEEKTSIGKIPTLCCTLLSSLRVVPSPCTQSLCQAILENNLIQVRSILSSNREKLNPDYKWHSGNTILHLAASQGHLKICETLLDYLADLHINARNVFLKQPLHCSSEKGHLETCKLLVRSGADISPIDKDGNTPLHYACKNNHLKVVDWLVTRGANLHISNKYNQKPFDLASHLVLDRIQAGTRTARPSVSVSTNPSEGVSPLLHREIGLSSFKLLQLLGRGSFGDVYLVREIESNELFALKVLNKELVNRKNLINYVMTERNVLSQLSHPFIVSLHYAFQTNTHFFLVLEYCPGGDLSKILSIENRFPEPRAKLYICEILLALEELHKRNIIFRDLKPENIVVDSNGHALLTDFGLSKEGVNEGFAAKTFCGSTAYLAPEIIKRRGHGKAVDWYLLGVVYYEMIVGYPPYYCSNKDALLNNIQHGKLKIPSFLSLESKELIKDLLIRDPAKRLGAMRDAEEIKQHRFFSDVDWGRVYRKEMLTEKVAHLRIQAAERSLTEIFTGEEVRKKVPGWSFIIN